MYFCFLFSREGFQEERSAQDERERIHQSTSVTRTGSGTCMDHLAPPFLITPTITIFMNSRRSVKTVRARQTAIPVLVTAGKNAE